MTSTTRTALRERPASTFLLPDTTSTVESSIPVGQTIASYRAHPPHAAEEPVPAPGPGLTRRRWHRGWRGWNFFGTGAKAGPKKFHRRQDPRKQPANLDRI